ncbi:hypothetical protein AAFM72_06710 [Acidithiobacillus sulfuriphilus]
MDVAVIVSPHQNIPRSLPSIKITLVKTASRVRIVYFSFEQEQMDKWIIVILSPGRSAHTGGADCSCGSNPHNVTEIGVD